MRTVFEKSGTALVVALVFVVAGIWPSTLGAGQSAVQLVMFEQQYCEWCERWDEEVGVVYPKTKEGRAAPLRRVDIHDARPADLKALKGIRYTPTFVVIADGKELGRILGYPGEAFFWGLLGDILKKHGNLAGL